MYKETLSHERLRLWQRPPPPPPGLTCWSSPTASLSICHRPVASLGDRLVGFRECAPKRLVRAICKVTVRVGLCAIC